MLTLVIFVALYVKKDGLSQHISLIDSVKLVLVSVKLLVFPSSTIMCVWKSLHHPPLLIYISIQRGLSQETLRRFNIHNTHFPHYCRTSAVLKYTIISPYYNSFVNFKNSWNVKEFLKVLNKTRACWFYRNQTSPVSQYCVFVCL